MSAKAITTCNFEPAAQQTVATDHPAPHGRAAGIRFREVLWREYRNEAINAVFSVNQATEYASALKMPPAERGWFYQGRSWVVNRTVASGLITLARWRNSKTIGRTAAAGVSILAPDFRPWNTGRQS